MHLSQTGRWQTRRIELFVLEPEHASDAYVGWLNDPEVNRFLESRFAVHDREGVAAFIAAALADPKTLFLGIRDREIGRHVGNIKVAGIDRHHGLGEVGVMIGDRGAWGRGIGSEAIQCVGEIARHELGLRKLTAGCYGSNAASAKAFEKAGFHIEARRPRHFLLDGQTEDLILMARLLDE
jgi:RimJ/RimL family protein N-acetyltransferase